MMREEFTGVVKPDGGLRGATRARMVGVPFRAIPSIASAPRRGVEAPRQAPTPSAMDRSRQSLPVIIYPAPDTIPSAATLAAALAPAARGLCLAALARPRETAAALDALEAATPPARRRPPIDLAAMIEAGEPADHDVHDAFFNIARCGHDHPLQGLISLLRSRATLWDDLAETPSTLPDADLAVLDRGMSVFAAALLGAPPPAAARLPRCRSSALHAESVARRWLRGHQIFTALSQGLIFAVDALQAATMATDGPARDAAADLMIAVMDACGCALAFTGDFDVALYDELIRANMSPPYQPKGFSGLLSADHRELVCRLKAARPAMDRLRADDPLRHAAVVDALAGVYDRHKHVCGRFVGVQRASLLMAKESGRSGVDQLERFKINRLRQLGPKQDEPPPKDRSI